VQYLFEKDLKNIRKNFQNELEKYLKIDLNKHLSDDPKLKLDLTFIPSHFNLILYIQNLYENAKRSSIKIYCIDLIIQVFQK
jgi:hypothetical protein